MQYVSIVDIGLNIGYALERVTEGVNPYGYQIKIGNFRALGEEINLHFAFCILPKGKTKMYNSTFPESFALRDGVLRINCISHPSHTKSDGFLFALNGHFMLHDGGITGATDALEHLLALREVVCPDGVLHFDWVISHYHVDHVVATIENILPDPRFAIDKVIMPPRNMLPEGVVHGEAKYRPRIIKTLEKYHPTAEIVKVHYYSEKPETIPYNFGGTEITILPPDTDWSAHRELYEIIAKGYFGYDDITDGKVPTCVGNAASLWFLINYGGRRLLFTGDSMKRTREITEESVDRMYNIYGDMLGRIDFAKWPHHGMARDNADTMMRALDPDYILTTTKIESASVKFAKDHPDHRAIFINCCYDDVIVSVRPDGIMSISGGKRGVNDGEFHVLTEYNKK